MFFALHVQGSRRVGLLLLLPALVFAGCGGGSSSDGSSDGDFTAFGNPEAVLISGYDGDAMEPFLSRDGQYLFFNNAGGPTDKDIFYATMGDETTFQFQGALSEVNSAAVDGVPSMDDAGRFFFISTVSYSPPGAYDTVFSGAWNGSTVTGISPVSGLASAVPGMIVFDVEASPDGSTLYFADGDFSTGGGGLPGSADIVVAVDSGTGFIRDPDSEAIMAGVNTDALEYAPAISADGLEFFFTRLDPGTNEARIYRAARAHPGSPFEAPQLVSAITGFTEGPALSPDEKSLYYHKLNTSTGRFEIYRVTR